MTTWQTYYARASQPCSRRGILPCQKTIRNELLIYAFACLSLSETILHHWDQNLCRLQTGNPYCQHHSDYSHQQPTNNLEFCPKHRACSRILPCSDCQPVQSSIMFLSPLFVPSLASPPAACIHLLPLSAYSTINHVSIAVYCSKFVSTSTLLYCLLMHPKHLTIVSHGISTSHLNRFAVIVGNKCNFESITSFSVTIEI